MRSSARSWRARVAHLQEVVRKFHAADVRWTDDVLGNTISHPGFWVRRRLRQAIASHAHLARGTLLDVGCGLKPYEKLLSEHVSRYIGIEYAPGSGYRGNDADLYSDAAALPIADEAVDTVLCTEVLEHVPNPGQVAAEIARVLRKGGLVLCTAPFFYPTHDRLDFFRYSGAGVAALMTQHGLQIQQTVALSGTGVTLAVLINLYLVEIGFVWTRWLYPIGLALRPLLWLLTALMNIMGWMMERALPSAHMAFNHLTIARKLDTYVMAATAAQVAASMASNRDVTR